MLIVMAGLPGSGKSTVADLLGVELGCAVLSVDPIEAAMWRAGIDREQPTGLAAYVVAEDLARIQLGLGHDILVDAVNDVEAAREQWRRLARESRTQLIFVEVYCSDVDEHRRRFGARRRDIPGFVEPSWESVLGRRSGLDNWSDKRVRFDSTHDLREGIRSIVDAIARHAAQESG